MATLERAKALAREAHDGQTDKAGAPYIRHPLRVMAAVASAHEKMAAVLHDIVEDTDVTLDDLLREGFPAEVVDAIDALTKRPGETRLDAAKRARANPIARAVKLADVADNMDLDRLDAPTEKDFARLEQYERVRRVLLGDA